VVDRFSAALGGRLRAARRQRGWSLSDVESITDGEFKASVVGAYERGERAISVQRLVRVADLYNMAPADLLPNPKLGEAPVIDIDRLDAGSGDLAEKYVAAIHLLRSESSSPEIRVSDQAILSSLLESQSTMVAGEN